MTAQVIRLNKTNFHDFMEDIVKAYDENRLDEFICIISEKPPEESALDGSFATTENYWFSGKRGSSVHTLGLLEVMKEQVMSYMFENG